MAKRNIPKKVKNTYKKSISVKALPNPFKLKW